MNEINIDDLLVKASNKFLLSNAAAGRAKQITEGSLPYVDHFDPNSPVITALREIAAEKIKIKVLSGPSKKAQELFIREEAPSRPSLLESLAKESKSRAKKEKKSKKK